MEELSQKLSALLNDPEGLERVKKMAENILGQEVKSNQSPLNQELFGAEDLQSIMSVISKLKTGSTDPRAQLLTALKPHLSNKRQDKVDTAIKILRFIELLPLLKDSGIFKL